MDYASKF